MDNFSETNDFAHLSAFLAAAEERSFTGAGRRLGVSGSAVGQSIKQFEQSLGVQLFVRTTRNVALTEQGASLLEQIRPAASVLTEALSTAKGKSMDPQGRVRIHSPRSAAEMFLMPMLADFSLKFPQIEIDITVDDHDPNVVSEGFDLVLKIGEVIDLDMIAVRLGGELRQIAVASPGFVERNGRPDHPRDLVNFPCVRWRWKGTGKVYDWEFNEDGRWFSVKVPGPLVVSDRQLILMLAMQDAGICFLGDEEASPFLERGDLVNLLDDWCAPFPGWHLCYPRQRYLPRATRLVIDAIRQEAAKRGT